jgi:superfamily II DNA/RNA helicase
MDSFTSLNLIPPLLDAISQMNFTKPTDIQSSVLPHALDGKDVIGIAETGSGKTAAFALPILQALWNNPKGLFAWYDALLSFFLLLFFITIIQRSCSYSRARLSNFSAV